MCMVMLSGVVHAQNTAFNAAGAGGGAVIPGKDTRVCGASIEGAMRYQRGQSSSISNVNLLGYWRLDETVNTTAQDSSGNGYNGAVVGTNFAVSGVPAMVNNGLNLDGVDDSVDLGTQAALKPSLPATYAAWVYLSSNSIIGTLFANDSQNVYSGLWVQISATLVVAQMGDNTGVGAGGRRTKASTSLITQAGWYHIAVVWRGITDMSIYINGVDAAGTYSGSGSGLVYTANRSYIGRRHTTYLQAIVDEARFYSRALDAAEIRDLYTGNIQICTDKNGGYAWTNWGQ